MPLSAHDATYLSLLTGANHAQVSLFGFGFCDPTEARTAGIASNAVYYDQYDTRGKAGFGGYHNMKAEWAWVLRLNAQGLVKRVC